MKLRVIYNPAHSKKFTKKLAALPKIPWSEDFKTTSKQNLTYISISQSLFQYETTTSCILKWNHIEKLALIQISL